MSNELNVSAEKAKRVADFSFSDVSLKNDGSYVVTISGYRTHITADYNPPMFEAIQEFVEKGGHWSIYDEDVVVKTDPQLLAQLWSERQLQISEQVVAEYRDARDLEQPTEITSEQFSELLAWRQRLRGWQKTPEYPELDKRPVAPTWLKSVAEDVD
ncbi:hypothetical protein [Pseudomonas soli]|uniref:hypothetical protein n=1 Tax=Pseudomonas soli TaxID=1306993 RepID=UPI003813EF57